MRAIILDESLMKVGNKHGVQRRVASVNRSFGLARWAQPHIGGNQGACDCQRAERDVIEFPFVFVSRIDEASVITARVERLPGIHNPGWRVRSYLGIREYRFGCLVARKW